jgi:hypothetical protein
MFGMMPVTSMELEADRRRELATSWKPVRTVDPVPHRGPGPMVVSLRRLIGSLTRVPPAGWEDVRT